MQDCLCMYGNRDRAASIKTRVREAKRKNHVAIHGRVKGSQPSLLLNLYLG
jgi:hypothetical protein